MNKYETKITQGKNDEKKWWDEDYKWVRTSTRLSLEVSTQLLIGYLQMHGAESGSKMRSNQNVHESWSYLKSRESQTFACWPHPSLWAIMHMILIWEWFRGMCCGNHSNNLQKDTGNWCLHGHAQKFLGVCSSRSKVQISRRFGIIAVFIEWMNGQSKEQGSEFNYESHTDMPSLNHLGL